MAKRPAKAKLTAPAKPASPGTRPARRSHAQRREDAERRQLDAALAGYIGEQFGQQRARGPALAPGLAAILGNIRFYFGRRGAAWLSSRALLVMMNESCIEAQPELRPVVAAYNRSALAWFEQHIATGIARGEIAPGHDPAITAVILLGAMRGVMLQWLVDPKLPISAVRDRLLQVVAQLLQRPS